MANVKIKVWLEGELDTGTDEAVWAGYTDAQKQQLVINSKKFIRAEKIAIETIKPKAPIFTSDGVTTIDGEVM
jgi:hypothetical protein